MKKKLIARSVLGVPLGISIGYLITIAVSLGLADGFYAPCVPALISVTGSEIRAVILQAALCGLLGAGFAASSVIWEMERWSIARQTGVYFLCISLAMLPVAYFTYWMEHSVAGFLRYFGIFALIFLLIWLLKFAVIRRSVKKLNETLRKTPGGEGREMS